MPFAWTPAVLDDLHRLFVRQELSAAETAQALGGGVTRNAVLGKVQRLGWIRPAAPKPGRPASGKRAKPKTARRTIRPGPFSRVLPLPKLREAALVSTPRLWTERADDECAYPVGEPKEPGLQFSCCAPVEGRRPYCAAHWRLMTLEGTALTPHDIEIIAAIARRAG